MRKLNDMEDQVNEPTLSYEKIYTYADYLTWQFKERIEILKGKVFKMSPAPARKHQQISFKLAYTLAKYFEEKECEVYTAPFDIRLVDSKKKSRKDEDIITVFQPDLCVVCDTEKLDERGCIGAPDLIIEILSPGNSVKEMKNKFELYEENSVREYWMVDYVEKTILIYVLENGIYRGLKPVTQEEIAKSVIFPNLEFDAQELFKD